MFNLGFYGVIVIISLVCSWFCVEFCRRLGWKYKLLDKPLSEGHKTHSKAVPVTGGLGMLLSLFMMTVFIFALMHFWQEPFVQFLRDGVFSQWQKLLILIIGAVGIFLIGWFDDFSPMKATTKLFGQFLLMSLVAQYGFQISCFIDNDFFNWLITLGWLIFVVNSINFFDNMDGLSSGIAMIAALFFTIIAFIQDQFLVTAVGALTCGTAWGFYRHNRFPAKIFMGDAGSHLLGYLLAVLGGMVTYYNSSAVSYLPILSPLFILALPIFDTLVVFTLRKLNGQSLFVGDHNHISHRFVAMGFTKKDAVFLIHILQFIFGLLAIMSIQANLRISVVVVLIAISLLLFIVFLHTKSFKNKF